MSDKAVEPPSPVAIACALTESSAALAGDTNVERECLKEAHRHLSQQPPDIEKARAELAHGMAHAFRGSWREDKRPEAWLIAACAQLLSNS